MTLESQPQTDPAVLIADLGVRFGERAALDGVSFDVARGAFFGVLGPNGSGKTTLFRVVSTLLAPQRGRVEVSGYDVARDASRVRHQIGVAFQSPSLDGRLTCEENLLHHGRLYGLHGRALRQRIDERLERFGVLHRRADRTSTLSGGLKRRVELARATLHRPAVLLLDEPSAGLDPTARRSLWATLREHSRAEGTTVLLTTHLMDEAEPCDEIVILDEGHVAARGAPAALKGEVGGDVVVVETDDTARVAAEARRLSGVSAQVIDGTVRIARPDAAALAAQLAEAMPDAIRSIHVRHPTLEDVFERRTGRRFHAGSELEDAA